HAGQGDRDPRAGGQGAGARHALVTDLVAGRGSLLVPLAVPGRETGVSDVPGLVAGPLLDEDDLAPRPGPAPGAVGVVRGGSPDLGHVADLQLARRQLHADGVAGHQIHLRYSALN